VAEDRWAAVARLARLEQAPRTTSAGRLFDAIGAICGLRNKVTYEGQAAVELESAADPSEGSAYPMELGDGLVIDPRQAVAATLQDIAAGVPRGAVAMRFHRALARATAEACSAAAEAASLATVVLSGGVFQNRLLTALTTEALEARGLRVLVPRRLPPNDGGIAYGQAAVAAAAGG
jgi:hydrogenase maturation protein HypF